MKLTIAFLLFAAVASYPMEIDIGFDENMSETPIGC